MGPFHPAAVVGVVGGTGELGSLIGIVFGPASIFLIAWRLIRRQQRKDGSRSERELQLRAGLGDTGDVGDFRYPPRRVDPSFDEFMAEHSGPVIFDPELTSDDPDPSRWERP